LEPERHLFFIPEDMKASWTGNVDEYGDSFARDTSVDELQQCMDAMADIGESGVDQISDLFSGYMDMRGFMFHGLTLFFDRPGLPTQDTSSPSGARSIPDSRIPASGAQIDSTDLTNRNTALFAGAEIVPNSTLTAVSSDDKKQITHIIAHRTSDLPSLRREVSRWPGRRIPRIVTAEWIETSWKEGTRVDEEAFVAR
jgi:DNA ligase-4